MDIKCKFCGRHLFKAVSTTILESLICGNTKCKARLNIHIVTNDSTPEQIHYKFTTPETPPKAKQ